MVYPRFVSACAVTLAMAAAAPAAIAEDAVKVLNFGIISTESSQNLRQDWQPLLEDMSKKLGVKINAFFAPDYAGVIEGMRFTHKSVNMSTVWDLSGYRRGHSFHEDRWPTT